MFPLPALLLRCLPLITVLRTRIPSTLRGMWLIITPCAPAKNETRPDNTNALRQGAEQGVNLLFTGSSSFGCKRLLCMGVVTPGTSPEEQTLEVGPKPPTPYLLQLVQSSDTWECKVLDGYSPKSRNHLKGRQGALGIPIPRARKRLLSQQRHPRRSPPGGLPAVCQWPQASCSAWTGLSAHIPRPASPVGGLGSSRAGSMPACTIHPWFYSPQAETLGSLTPCRPSVRLVPLSTAASSFPC